APRIQGHVTDAIAPHPPTPRLRLELPLKSTKLVRGTLTFAYGALEAGYSAANLRSDAGTFRRHLDAETARIVELQELGLTVELAPAQGNVQPFAVKFDVRDFEVLGPQLLEAGYQLEVAGKRY